MLPLVLQIRVIDQQTSVVSPASSRPQTIGKMLAQRCVAQRTAILKGAVAPRVQRYSRSSIAVQVNIWAQKRLSPGHAQSRLRIQSF